MPKIEVNEAQFFSLLGRRYSRDELEAIFPVAKAELDEWDEKSAAKPEDRSIKIELNDTNRPDLWSSSGVARQLKAYQTNHIPQYPFFSKEGEFKDSGSYTVEVDPSVKDIRPFIAAFVISGKPISEPMLKDIIQTQEKLCWNYGRKRRSIAMGVYRCSGMKFPVKYQAVDPDKTKFAPLGETREMSLREILVEHPKGKEFSYILDGLQKFPYLTDANGETLSFPPIINSNKLGAVQVGDKDLFVELTGTDLHSLCIAASIVACDFADSGYEIKPVRVEYPYDTNFGKSVVFPYYFQKPVTCGLDRLTKFLGRKFSAEEVEKALTRMGCKSAVHGQYVQVFPPEYRNDFLHAADVTEDVMIGFGMENFTPQRPKDFTIGRLTPLERLSRKAKDIMVGQGFQEMIYNYLGSRSDYIERMNITDESLIQITNPMSENYEFVRNSPLPGLLLSESVSGQAVYPHRMFEVGKVVYRAPEENYGCKTRQWMGFLISHAEADFNEAASVVSALCYYMGFEYSVKPSEDPRFIHGRQAELVVNGKNVGVFGEANPEVLTRWGISVPTTLGELDINTLLELEVK
jgi:phenylalanyl-tRNA synthetase beta chain